MGLPFTRERTYDDTTPVDPNDMNALQDAIAAEHNRPLHFGPASFQPTNHDLQLATDGHLYARDPGVGSGVMWVVMDLSPWIIPGDTIKELIWRWSNGTNPNVGAVEINLKNVTLATGAAGALAIVDSDDTSTGGAELVRSATVAVNHTVLANHVYFILFKMDDTGNDDQAAFRGVTVVLEAP